MKAALAEVLARATPVATPATSATRDPDPGAMSQKSRKSQGQSAQIAGGPFPSEGKPADLIEAGAVSVAPPDGQATEDFPYGFAPNGYPRTWTGRIVRPDEWHRLSTWDRHGSTGKLWNALTGAWEPLPTEDRPACTAPCSQVPGPPVAPEMEGG